MRLNQIMLLLLLLLQLSFLENALCASTFQRSNRQAETTSNFGEVCYDGIGCFRNDGHFFNIPNRPISWLPWSPESINTLFALFTRRNPTFANWILYDKPQTVYFSNFDLRKETKVIIHGFTDSINSGWMTDFRDVLLQHGDYNILLVDWSRGNQYPYAQATANSRVAGAITAQLLGWMEQKFSLDLQRTHILGQSLGAHVAGYVGLRLKYKIGRITGMDPAGPYYEFMHPDVRLDHTDAKFVDVIHTDGGPSWDIIQQKGGFGMMQPSGHVDFYPNGGKQQPACKKDRGKSRDMAQVYNEELACNHVIVISVTMATVTNSKRQYKAVPCDSYEQFKAGKCSCGKVGCASMGINADKWNRNGRHNVRMFLDTTDAPPYEVPL